MHHLYHFAPLAPFAPFAPLAIFQTYDEGVSTTTTVRGSVNDANDFVLTGKNVLEQEVDRVRLSINLDYTYRIL